MRGLIYKDLYLIKGKVLAGGASVLFIILSMYIVYACVGGKVLFPADIAAIVTDIYIVLYVGAISYGYIIRTDTYEKRVGILRSGTSGQREAGCGCKVYDRIYHVLYSLCNMYSE